MKGIIYWLKLYWTIKMIKEMQSTNTIPITFSSDDNYALYLGVCIKSPIEHASSLNHYEIFIIDGGINENHKIKYYQ